MVEACLAGDHGDSHIDWTVASPDELLHCRHNRLSLVAVDCRLPPLHLVGVGVAPTLERDHNRVFFAIDGDIDRLRQRLVADRDSRRVVIHRLPDDAWTGQKCCARPEHSFGHVAAKGRTPVVRIAAQPGDG